ncbi:MULTISPECIES: hypothetical protein [Edwardsiella]|uniref:Uncharacterized protein n=2 Tax=Edwardsiella anguillarum TaxID=1821960 RepID=A0A076LT85_9GAMM|nr:MULTISPECIES: hypothetical protein [Edwardsiella]AKM48045.1 hypothetical protein QY76_12570 [Edwardsiella sp. EA181011]GAJ68373.1 hypothetical protein MA13_contig00010-0108 [Edwardsiella piscicida]AIJ09892.1 Hypothetical protein ETEE_3470 [Edwardsiella anguillarum ET080813]AKR77566.1 hypothetical protein AAZ33_07640 [Edwardsiella sp. LADL05-105]KAB0589313.1 hypothetical protein F7P84_15135 [Edwardsiella anguillarum]
MDVTGILIASAAALSGVALLITLFADRGAPRFLRTPSPRAEPRCDRARLPAQEETPLPPLGNPALLPTAQPRLGSLEFPLPAPRIALGNLGTLP